MNKKGIATCIIVIISLLASAMPKEVDSLLQIANKTTGEAKVEALIYLSQHYRNTNADSSLHFANLALIEAKKDGGSICLQNAYYNIGNCYSEMDSHAIAIQYFLKSYEYAVQTNRQTNAIYCLMNTAYSCMVIRKEGNAIGYLNKGIEISRKINNYELESQLLYRLSNVFFSIRDFNKSLEYAIKTINILKEHNIKAKYIEVHMHIGMIHYSLKNFLLAKDYLEIAHEMCVKEKNTNLILEVNNSLGMTYDELGEYKKAIQYYQDNIDICRTLGDTATLAVAYNNMGYAFNNLKEYDKAIEAYNKSLKINRLTTSDEEYLNIYNNIASTYIEMGDLTNAEKYAIVVANNISAIHDITYLEETFKILGTIATMKGDYRNAYLYTKKELRYHDSIYSLEKNRSAIEMQIRFDTEDKEREIELLKREQEINLLHIQRQNIAATILTGSLILMSLLTLITIWIYRIIKKKNKLYAIKNQEFEKANEQLEKSRNNLKELNATKDKLFSIIAHDLRNPFSALLGFSGLLDSSYDTFTENEKKEYIGAINESAQNLYRLLDNLLQWSRAQIGTISYTPEDFKLVELISQEVITQQNIADRKKIKILVEISDNLYVSANKNTIASVVRNLLSNAIKFTSKNGNIRVVAYYLQYSNMIDVAIIDSGIGISNNEIDKLFEYGSKPSTKGTENEQGSGLGLMLCREFVENNGGRIWATSQKGKGSEFHFTINPAQNIVQQ